jgi:hypothetical protein
MPEMHGGLADPDPEMDFLPAKGVEDILRVRMEAKTKALAAHQEKIIEGRLLAFGRKVLAITVGHCSTWSVDDLMSETPALLAAAEKAIDLRVLLDSEE